MHNYFSFSYLNGLRVFLIFLFSKIFQIKNTTINSSIFHNDQKRQTKVHTWSTSFRWNVFWAKYKKHEQCCWISKVEKKTGPILIYYSATTICFQKYKKVFPQLKLNMWYTMTYATIIKNNKNWWRYRKQCIFIRILNIFVFFSLYFSI